MVVQIDKIQGLTPEDVRNLQTNGIKTMDDLWSQVGSDFDEGIQEVATATKVNEEVITALLIADSLGQLNIKYRLLSSFRNQHGIAYSTLKTLLIAVVLATLVYLSYRAVSKIDFPQQVVVANPRGIPAYRVITITDITQKRVLFRRGKTVSDPASVIGGYALTKLDPNARIRDDQILPVADSKQISGRYIVSVPVKTNSLVLTPKPGSQIALLLTPDTSNNKAPATSVVYGVFLGVEQREGGPAVVVAVNNMEQINGLLGGTATIGIMQPAEGNK